MVFNLSPGLAEPWQISEVFLLFVAAPDLSLCWALMVYAIANLGGISFLVFVVTLSVLVLGSQGLL